MKDLSINVQLKNVEELQNLIEKAAVLNFQLKETLQQIKDFSLET